MTKELQVENDEQPNARGATATHRRGPGHRLTLADVMATLSEGLAHLLQRMELPVHVAMLASNGSGHLARYTLNLDGSAHSEFLAEYDDQGQGWRFPVHGLLLDNIGATARIVVMEKKRGNWNGQAQDYEERIERAVGPYIDAVGHAWDPKRAVRALRVEFGDELTPAIEQRALQMILKRIQDKRILEGYAKWKAGHSLQMSKPKTEKVASNDILLSKTRRP